ncbi:MAG TPA: isoaspartyl peptidase/L-asparaginase [Bacteroidia bacterium]|nr:isoaspartyl peptidase/L-asparaginase [Bacteroidia bacterium]
MYSIAIHGGAGTILKSQLTADMEKAYSGSLFAALQAGERILKEGGAALDAVTAAVKLLEDDPLFNAGKGSVFTFNEKHEMDASIMNGANRACGAVAGVSNVKNPVLLARMVMEQTEHVLLSGEGAEELAHEKGLVFEPDSYFFSEFRHRQWKQVHQSGTTSLDHLDEKKFGTVGAVALDDQGNLAAATSTGGMTNKKYNRIGDTPLIGSGTYANNETCAVSCTGHGEFFIRQVTAYDISCLMEYRGLSLSEACTLVVKNKLVELGGEGGVIAVDRKGNIEMVFNSEGMYRGRAGSNLPAEVAIYG